MARLLPIFVTEHSAALLLDMKTAEFRRLVKAGHLPGPSAIGPHERWDVEALRKIASGRTAEPERMEW